MENIAYVGIDWASTKHDYEIRYSDGRATESGSIEHDAKAIKDLFSGLAEKKCKEIKVCSEQSKGHLFNILSEVPGIKLYAANPVTVTRFRKAFVTSGAKSDTTDASFICDVIQKHENHLKLAKQPDDTTQRLEILSRQRRDMVDDRVRLGLKLRDNLKQYFPQSLSLFDDLTTLLACKFLLKWSELLALKKEKSQVIEDFLIDQHSTKQTKNKKRLELIKTSTAAIVSRAVIDSYVLSVRRYCDEILIITKHIKQIDIVIDQVAKQHSDYQLFKSFPKMGPVSVARIIATFGSDKSLYEDADGFINSKGISPITVQSGKSAVIRARVAKSKFDHQSLVEWAGQTVTSCQWAKNFYAKKRAKGSSHRVAIRALAFKWSRILFACWKSNTTYSEEVCLKKKNLNFS